MTIEEQQALADRLGRAVLIRDAISVRENYIKSIESADSMILIDVNGRIRAESAYSDLKDIRATHLISADVIRYCDVKEFILRTLKAQIQNLETEYGTL